MKWLSKLQCLLPHQEEERRKQEELEALRRREEEKRAEEEAAAAAALAQQQEEEQKRREQEAQRLQELQRQRQQQQEALRRLQQQQQQQQQLAQMKVTSQRIRQQKWTVQNIFKVDKTSCPVLQLPSSSKWGQQSANTINQNQNTLSLAEIQKLEEERERQVREEVRTASSGPPFWSQPAITSNVLVSPAMF